MRQALLLFVMWGALLGSVLADEAPKTAAQATFVLKDRSQLRGRILSFKDGVYRISNPVLGELDLPTGKLLMVVFDDSALPGVAAPGAAAAGGPAGAAGNTGATASSAKPAGQVQLGLDDSLKAVFSIEGVMQSLTSDKDSLDEIAKLAEDPEVQALLNDPQVLKAIEGSDFSALANNPKVQALMKNPRVQKLTRKAEAGTDKKP